MSPTSEPYTVLTSLLDEEADLIKRGDLKGVNALMLLKEKAFEDFERTGVPDAAAVNSIVASLKRNGSLMTAALSGLRDVLAQMPSRNKTLTVYGACGLPESIESNTENFLQKTI
ncbi:hypothetical protein [Pseudoprimorskyibacter insulae]|uniref:Uncharacterized protein n=1 Tax=Pseudoprimorskyibacter insulae TaxID=1695997 RepID=A0A2R8AYT0_9RHOB|nr:hypothetical protein [Pseudoprimorskyibacter insulae]SPF81205.1 hypothetical protein PRI8871_03027 [Pseudoprimorskyibacter insulae]